MEIIGKVIQIMPAQTGMGKSSGKPWMLQTFVIETIENYPKRVCIELFGEDRIKANPIAIDEVVTVSFDLESREFNGRWYTSVRAWKVQQGAVQQTAVANQPAPQAAPAAQPMAAPQPAANTQPFDSMESSEDTDLPF